MPTLHLTPAYGRDYKSREAIKKDWDANKDFRISDVSSPYDGKLINKQDAENFEVAEVLIRYNKLTKTCVITLMEKMS